ncbi:MAG: hypothetical protein NC548_25805 [Lachnospiraceae bacterium]|nr:hypothetical protein [Lachnospiraceae bacterium]
MRKAQKKQIEEILALLEQAHEEIRGFMEHKEYEKAMELLGQCQESAVQVGGLIEKTEGENAPAVARLEAYCEQVYEVYEALLAGTEINAGKLWKKLRKSLIQAENSVKNDIRVRLEMVFLPYKASMWDSLESVWRAADADPDCDAYVIPIPYYDRNRDGSFGACHYEGDLFPADVPVTHYTAYLLEERRPDAVFIHNPYDQYNNVTSVHPRFYSQTLKKDTDCLVYVPYYITSGGMSEAQGYMPSYYFVDYIVIQNEKFRSYFDPALPKEKFLPFGSPKADKVIRLCQDPPEPPEAWKEKLAGKKVYFYNTSINGMLADTEAFLKKMEYVFRCFAACETACLLWRPHPLLESTFDSMRSAYRPFYDKLKQYFLESGLGIYDDTPEIEPAIALCDAYIGDSGTSVTSLFGAAGKPVFVLNNFINTEPQEDDWRGEIIQGFSCYGNDSYMVTQGNKLYYAPAGDYRYRYCCNLSDYSGSGQYLPYIISVMGKDYVCPCTAQEILLLDGQKVSKRVKLNRRLEQGTAFHGAVGCGKYLLLIPNQYPAVVRYDTETGEIRYFEEHSDVGVDFFQGERRAGGYCSQGGYLFLASPVSNRVLALQVESGKMQVLTIGAKNNCGCLYLVPDGETLWLIPYEGYIVTRWNPESGEVREYDCYVEGMRCIHPTGKYECETAPFGFPAVLPETVYLPANWGNRCLQLDQKTGEVSLWRLPFSQPEAPVSGYYPPGGKADFVSLPDEIRSGKCRLFSYYDKKLYMVDLSANAYWEEEIVFSIEELQEQEAGFLDYAENALYVAFEGAFYSLPDFLAGRIRGNLYDREKAIKSFQKIMANYDGICGEKTYDFMKQKLTG